MKPHERTRAYQEALEDYVKRLRLLMTSIGFVDLPEPHLVKPHGRGTSLATHSAEVSTILVM